MKMPSCTKNRFLLLYGSQTGQAKAISEEICEKAENHGLHVDIHCLSKTEKKFCIEKEKCVVIVTSTTGDGEPPDTALKFIRRLKKKTLPNDYLEDLNYTLLGLGDSNYTNFCNCGKGLDRRLEELGAKRFYPSGWADDAVGLEVVVESWMEGLIPALQKFLGIASANCDESLEELAVSGLKSSAVNNVSDQSEKLSAESHAKGNSPDGTTLFSSMEEKDVGHAGNGRAQISVDSSGDKIGGPNAPNSAVMENVKNLDLEKGASENSHRSSEKSESAKSASVNMDHNVSVSDLHTEQPVPSVRHSVPPVSESSITVPILPPIYLLVNYHPDETVDLSSIPIQNGCKLPSAATEVAMTPVKAAEKLTTDDAVKTTLLLTLDIKDSGIEYEPGDSISVVCHNDPEEVEMLLDRLGLRDKADTPITLDIMANTKKRNASVPSHIPPRCTLRHIFCTCIDIREPPKKALLRALVDHTSNDQEKRRLQELCSKQGSGDYSSYIREPSLCILDVLNAFPCCHPPVERILEHLPRLQPRPYSACSCPSFRPDVLQFAFNLIAIPAGDGRSYDRKGVCTTWLDLLTKELQTTRALDGDTDVVTKNMANLSLTSEIKIPVFGRTSQHFRTPENASVPIIMIGPGTGVAPFIGFLQRREIQRQQLIDKDKYGQTWLFFGCRHKNRDFLFRKDLENFEKSGTLTRLCVSFSRDEQTKGCPKYVQDSLVKYGEDILSLIDHHDAVVFVCGDAKNMAKDVNSAFTQILQSDRGLSESDARDYMMKMRLHRKYLEDVWT